MLFAALDFLHYRRRTGRFGDDQRSVMSLGFLGQLPDDVIADLEIGDFILTQRLDSWFSWAMLYFTSSSIDHVALYIGDGRIAHVTLSGFKKHSIHVFGSSTRVIALRFAPPSGPIPFEFDDGFADGYKDFDDKQDSSNTLSPKIQLALVGAQIVAGLYPDRFRWKFLLDFIVLGLGLDLVFFWLINVPLFTVVLTVVAALFAVIFGINRLRMALGARVERLNHPDHMMRAFKKTGGMMFTSLGPLVACDLGFLPIKALRALGRERPQDSPDDKLEPLRQYIRDILECWNLPIPIEETENKESQQHDEKED